MIQGTSRANIIADIRNRDDGVKATGVGIGGRPDSVIEITCITWVNCDNRQMAQIFAMIVRDGQLANAFRFSLGRLGHFERNAKFVNGDEAEAFGCKRVAKYLSDSRRFLVRISCQFGQYKFTCLRIANVADLGIEPRFLVY